MPELPNDDGWWWIVDDPTLSVHEKMIAMAIYRKQFRGNSVALTRKVIGELASVSRRQVIRCEESLVPRGMLRIEATRHSHVFLYRVSRVQLGLFDRSSLRSSAGLAPASVQNAVDNNGITARPAGAGTETVPASLARPPDRACWAHIETEHHINSKSKTRAEVRLRDEKISGDEKTRRIEARDHRLMKEEDARREARVGTFEFAGPIRVDPETLKRILDRERRRG